MPGPNSVKAEYRHKAEASNENESVSEELSPLALVNAWDKLAVSDVFGLIR